MAKGGLLQVLAPVLGIGAALAAPELLPALGIGEAAGGAGTAAALADTGAGGLSADALLAAPETAAGAATELGAAPLAADALSGIGDVTGLLGAGAGALPGIAGQVADLGATQGGLLGADTAAAAPAAATAAPSLTSAAGPLAGPVDASAIAATPAAPGLATGPLPAGFTPDVSPDLTAGGLGPPPGVTDAYLGTSTLSPGYPGDTTVTTPISSSPVSGTGGAVFNPDLSDFAGGTPGAGGQDIGNFGTSAPTGPGGFASSVGDWALSHPGALLTAGIAGTQLLHGQPTYPAAQSLQGLASPIGTQGYGLVGAGGAGLQGQAATTAGETAALTAPLTTGVLPPGLQQMVQQGEQAQLAATRSGYANEGLSNSTLESSAEGQVKAGAAAESAQLAEGLLPAAAQFSGQTGQAYNALTQAGATLSGMSLSAYNDLLRTQMQSDQNYQAALYKFAAALAGGGYQPPVANA